MKNLKIVCLAVFAAVVLFSCKDETGDYVEQLYTNNQKEAAIKACLKVSADTASAHLFVPDGFAFRCFGRTRIWRFGGLISAVCQSVGGELRRSGDPVSESGGGFHEDSGL